MVNQETLDRLRDDFPTSSWAIWSDNFPKRTSIEAANAGAKFADFIEDHASKLRPDIVFLGLNPSTEEPGNFTNFHSVEARHQDAWLRVFIEEAGLDGAYMTDLSCKVEGQAADVTFDGDPTDYLGKQLERIDEESYDVICFGRKTYRAARSPSATDVEDMKHGIEKCHTELRGHQVTLYSVYHFSQFNPDYLEKLRDQLEYLGQKLN